MKKIYYLSTCSTCTRILKELHPTSEVVLQDIKHEPISEKQIDEMKQLSGSYESLFSRRAIKYRSMGLADQDLKESDYKKHIIDEYTFLKRPVIIVNDEIFVGNSKKVIIEAKKALDQ